jgi:hypothetical protein
LRILLGVVVCALGAALFGPFGFASRVLCWWAGFRAVSVEPF